MRKATIIAMGGGGFSMEPENPLLDDYVLSLTGKDRPSVCFVPTASGDAEGYIERFHAAFAERADTAVLRLFRRSEADLAAFVARQDVVYVGGGNTANMLAVWRIHGLDAILRSAWRRGTILCGLSAGALCWFEGGVTDSFGERLAPLRDGLGLLPGSFCPHYDGEPMRRPAYEQLVQQRELAGGWAADDGVALHFEGTELVSVVASRSDAAAWWLAPGNGDPLSVRRLQPLLLGKLSPQEQLVHRDRDDNLAVGPQFAEGASIAHTEPRAERPSFIISSGAVPEEPGQNPGTTEVLSHGRPIGAAATEAAPPQSPPEPQQK